MDKLRECPFCGKPAVLDDRWANCSSGDCQMMDANMEVDEWNSRPSPWRTGKPEEEGDYLVSGEQDSVFLVAVWMDGNWWTPYPFPSEEIKFWMKVPRLPDKGE